MFWHITTLAVYCAQEPTLYSSIEDSEAYTLAFYRERADYIMPGM